jgi:uncharacterized protein (TIGR03435 family)
MPDANDMDLLRDFARGHSEAAFAELVRRHVNLVYSVALRFTADPSEAEDVSQAVFILLARKAASLSPKTVLTGWLYETTRLTAAGFLRSRRRRQAHEQEACMQSDLTAPDDAGFWQQLSPHLEAAMTRLSHDERTLLALRFYENKTGAEAAAQLGIREEAAHKRTARALEKLRRFFGQKGITLSAAALATAVSAHAVQAAPVGLAKTISAVAVVKGVAASTSTLTLVKGALKVMAWTKAKTAIVVAVALAVTIATPITIQEIQEHQTYVWQNLPADSGLLDHLPPQVKIRRSKYASFGICEHYGKTLELGASIKQIVAAAYNTPTAHVLFSTPVIPGQFDLFANLTNDNATALQRELKRQFGLIGKVDTRNADALLLKVKDPAALRSHLFKGQDGFKVPHGLQYGRSSLAGVGNGIELIFDQPVVDATGTSNEYHLQFLANETDWNSIQTRLLSVRQTLTDEMDQAGLELVPTNMPLEMLVVEKAP